MDIYGKVYIRVIRAQVIFIIGICFRDLFGQLLDNSVYKKNRTKERNPAKSRIFDSTAWVACVQALLFERVKRVSRERASKRESRDGLAQIGELARRLRRGFQILPYGFHIVSGTWTPNSNRWKG